MTFKTNKLSVLADIQTGPFGSQLHQRDYVIKGTPIVTVEHLGNRRFSNQNLPMVSDSDKLRLFKYTLDYGDIVFSRVGSVDRCSLVLAEKGWMFSGRCLRVKPNKNEIIPEYLYYFFTTSSFKEHIRRIAVGATMPSINTELMSNIPISYPTIGLQKAIANILSSLDDKIELNNKINKNLEEIAQTLYKRWFVDFEFPDENGKPYKSSGGEMVDSELGMIPKGWEVVSVEKLVTKSNVKLDPSTGLKLIDMANMPTYSISLNSYGEGDKLTTNTYRMEKGSFLYGSIRPYLGKFGIAPFDGLTTGTIHNFCVKREFDYSFVAATVFLVSLMTFAFNFPMAPRCQQLSGKILFLLKSLMKKTFQKNSMNLYMIFSIK